MRVRSTVQLGTKKMFVDEMDHAPGKVRWEIRTVIDGAIFDQAASYVDAREFFEGRVAYIRIGFVVAQQDVEFWFVLLDEIIFERQRFFFVVDDDVVDFGDLAHERAGFGVQRAGFHKIVAHSASQRQRFSHVDDLAGRIVIEIHARLSRKRSDFFAKIHDDRFDVMYRSNVST